MKTIETSVLGPRHPQFAEALHNLAALYADTYRLENAERLFRRVVTIQESHFDKDHLRVASALENLAVILVLRKRFNDAEPLFRRVLKTRIRKLGAHHPDVTFTQTNMATLHQARREFDLALGFVRDVMKTAQVRFADKDSHGSRSELRGSRILFSSFASILFDAHSISDESAAALAREAFTVGQWARVSKAGVAIKRMAARFAAGSEDVSDLVKQREDRLARLRFLDKAIIREVSKPADIRNPELEAEWRQEANNKIAEIAHIDVELKHKFKGYFRLISPAPAELSEVQRLLKKDEAMLAYVMAPDAYILFVLRHDDLRFLRLDMNRERASALVQKLRRAMNVTGTDEYIAPIYDLDAARRLYMAILAPALPHLKGVKHLFLAPDGPLESLPFSLLITEKPVKTLPAPQSYQQAAWLGRAYTLTRLPAVSALEALREIPPSKGSRPLIGFGDPAGLRGARHSADAKAAFDPGQGVNVQKLAALKRLRGARKELKALARLLKADPERDLYLGREASEVIVRRLSKEQKLEQARIVAFSTHGLTAGELPDVGNAEPGLVLTPPRKASADNDGFLAASEIALLKLDADWVILSACNTASADGTPNAKPLSGLARAFLYAGARSLLVSHWYVSDRHTARLLTSIMEAWLAAPARGRAHALQIAQAKLRENPETAHPNYWAPFTLIGMR